MILLIDNYDSFTYNLAQYFRMLGYDIEVLRNDAVSVEAIGRMDPQLIVISPGPGGPEATGVCREILLAYEKTYPFFGVCLGMQTIAAHFGGRVQKGVAPVHGKVRGITHGGVGDFFGLPSPYRVTRYHSLVVEERSLPECLDVTAKSEDGAIMGLQHRDLPISGVQFHPEALLTEFGLELLDNVVKGKACGSV